VALAVLEHVPTNVLLVRELEARPREKQVTREMRPLRVLVPTDGGPHSLAAVDRFILLFREPNLDVRVVSALDPAAAQLLESLATDEARALRSKLEHAARARVHEVVNRLAPHGITARSGVLDGRPADAVVKESRAMEADVVVLGSRGLHPEQERRLGSVALEIARFSPCSVLVVRET
jgi:nucleotide-binding universal stress UspA family protein